MRRRPTNLAAGISLLLCLGTAALSVRSNFVGYHASWARRPVYRGGLVVTQTVCLEFSGSVPRQIPFSFGSARVWPGWTPQEFRHYLYPGDRVVDQEDSQGECLGFGYFRGSYIDLFSQPRRARRVRVVGIYAPVALFTVLFGIPPLVVLLAGPLRCLRV